MIYEALRILPINCVHFLTNARARAQLEAYEAHKRAAEAAYAKAKALGLARLQSRNAQLAAAAGARPGHSPRAAASANGGGWPLILGSCHTLIQTLTYMTTLN